MAAEVRSPLFSNWHRPCHVIEGSPQGVAALAAAFETCGVSIEGRVSGHPAILGGLSSEPAASHPFETLFTGALVLEYGLLLGFLGGCEGAAGPPAPSLASPAAAGAEVGTLIIFSK